MIYPCDHQRSHLAIVLQNILLSPGHNLAYSTLIFLYNLTVATNLSSICWSITLSSDSVGFFYVVRKSPILVLS
ncbi:uncharacterized protein BJ212DRAFT_1362867 [Suillus subaureus]|uniref:Uncharacterized protein n=1 Tax=Suillus subaureus TaxID=48587 RepID=A0A9P7E8F8_9AGAM|nr:uncharacterized protein BJ212DRAFT_1362867 [Suillus subaureus]KAG1814314.1 hypothetical protein BJ212DRAFT_1362867 [Suillus subaureus]